MKTASSLPLSKALEQQTQISKQVIVKCNRLANLLSNYAKNMHKPTSNLLAGVKTLNKVAKSGIVKNQSHG